MNKMSLKFLLSLILLSLTLCFHFWILMSRMNQNLSPTTEKIDSQIFSPTNSSSQNNTNSSQVFQLPSEKAPESRTKPFKILLWTHWYWETSVSNIYYGDIGGPPEPCEDLQTIITFDKNEYDSADVVLFQIWDFNSMSQLPATRNSSVPWILCLQETPINHPWSHRSKYDYIFNYTWSLSDESEIHFVVNDMFEPRQIPDLNWKFGSAFSKEFMRNKTGMAAWVVSNFHMVHSKRTEFARKLQDYGVNITVFNSRSESSHGIPARHCPRSPTCFRDIGIGHKFYLSFENSLCTKMMSEKFALGILHAMVPIFYGIFNLSANAPPHSYIDAMEFNSTKDLAEYLIYLDKNDEEYFKYFEWRQNYSSKLSSTFSWSSVIHCPIWKQMWRLKQVNYENVYGDIGRWVTKFHKSEDGTYCDRCMEGDDIDVDNPRAAKERLRRGINCVN